MLAILQRGFILRVTVMSTPSPTTPKSRKLFFWGWRSRSPGSEAHGQTHGSFEKRSSVQISESYRPRGGTLSDQVQHDLGPHVFSWGCGVQSGLPPGCQQSCLERQPGIRTWVARFRHPKLIWARGLRDPKNTRMA